MDSAEVTTSDLSERAAIRAVVAELGYALRSIRGRRFEDGHYYLNAALRLLDELGRAGEISGDVLARGARLAEALAVIGGELEAAPTPTRGARRSRTYTVAIACRQSAEGEPETHTFSVQATCQRDARRFAWDALRSSGRSFAHAVIEHLALAGKSAVVMIATVVLFACSADHDNVRPSPAVAVPLERAPSEIQPVAAPVEPNRYTVYLASDEARAVEAMNGAMDRLNGVLGYDAFVWGQGAGDGAASHWAVTVRLDHALDEGPAVAVAGGADSWCDLALSPVRGLNRYVVQHEIGHCFELEHSEQRDSWMFYGPDYRTDVIPDADVAVMVARLRDGW